MHRTKVTRTCPVCGEPCTLEFDSEGLAQFASGTPVQEAFPHSSADDREFLLTGICPECWDNLWKED